MLPKGKHMKLVALIKARVQTFMLKLASLEQTDTALLMTLIWGLVYGPKELWYGAVYSALATSALLFAGLRKSERYWFVILCANTLYLVPNWYRHYNDFFLFTYWTLAVFLALTTNRPELLRRCSQLLLALTFTFATFWKILSPDFLNGDFFLFQMLSNYNFAALTEWLSPLSRLDVVGNEYLLPQSTYGRIAEGTVAFRESSSLAVWTPYFAIAATILEGLTALVFFVPSARFNVVRDVVLSLFMVLGYVILPVASLGVLIALLGYSQSNSHLRRAWFLLLFLLLQLFLLRLDILFAW